MNKSNITGLILAGGQARRMGGVDKGLLDFKNQAMILHVINRLSPQVETLLINANREIEAYERFGLHVISDQIRDFAGPLAGLHAGMQATKTEFVLSVPCDSPLLPDDLASRLMAALITHHAEIAVAKTGTQRQSVFCLCRKSLVADLADYLKAGGRKVDTWQNSHVLTEVCFDDNPQAFSNINTAEELSALERVC